MAASSGPRGAALPVCAAHSLIVPVGADAAQRAGADDLVVLDVEVIDGAGVDVAHDHVRFAGRAADIGKAEGLPVDPDAAHNPGAGELVMLDVEVIDRAG